MNKKIYITKSINETLDMWLLNNIYSIISSMMGEVDYLQVFHIERNKLVHSQEVPEYRAEYTLSKKYREYKIYAIRTDEENKSYWTVMFADEY